MGIDSRRSPGEASQLVLASVFSSVLRERSLTVSPTGLRPGRLVRPMRSRQSTRIAPLENFRASTSIIFFQATKGQR